MDERVSIHGVVCFLSINSLQEEGSTREAYEAAGFPNHGE